MSFIPLSAALKKEQTLILGVTILSFISSLLFGGFTHNKLSKMMKLKNRFIRNMNKERVVCYYQPLVDVNDNSFIGCEVLARWTDDDDTILTPPDKFLDIVREQNLTKQFTAIIIEKAFDELEHLLSSGRELKISFNIFPPRDFNTDNIQDMLNEHMTKFPTATINIELTEDEIIESPPTISVDITQLKKTELSYLYR